MGSSSETSECSPKSSEPAIVCRGVEKRFYFYEHRTDSLRQRFIRVLRRQAVQVRRPLFRLEGFDLEVGRGESVALVGANGSGKSTVLRLVAGIYELTAGEIVTAGRTTAVIELGAGFHGDLTGTENVRLYALLMGLGYRELAQRFDEIVSFSGIGDFIDTPVKYYSSGMQARLAFSVAMCTGPDILLLDEVLAVGDRQFRERCFDRLRDFHQAGGTLLLASHDLAAVRDLCSRAVWLDQGRIRQTGAVEEIIEAVQAASG